MSKDFTLKVFSHQQLYICSWSSIISSNFLRPLPCYSCFLFKDPPLVTKTSTLNDISESFEFFHNLHKIVMICIRYINNIIRYSKLFFQVLIHCRAQCFADLTGVRASAYSQSFPERSATGRFPSCSLWTDVCSFESHVSIKKIGGGWRWFAWGSSLNFLEYWWSSEGWRLSVDWRGGCMA